MAVATEQLPGSYAQAIFQQATEDWLTPLRYVAGRIKPTDVDALDNPALPFGEKQKVLQQLLPPNASERFRNFLSLLASKNEAHLLPNIIEEFDRYATRGTLHASARVTSAVPLTDKEKAALEGKLRERNGADLEFEYVVDSTILGGVVVRMGDEVIDGSVSGKLAALREKLK
jgi:F-type H+-transporting ATPase subunit delta